MMTAIYLRPKWGSDDTIDIMDRFMLTFTTNSSAHLAQQATAQIEFTTGYSELEDEDYQVLMKGAREAAINISMNSAITSTQITTHNFCALRSVT